MRSRTILLTLPSLVLASSLLFCPERAEAASVLVSDTGANVVLRYNVSGTTWTADGTFASGSVGGGPLAAPFGLAQDSLGRIYVGEEAAGGRILRYAADGTFLGVVATEGVEFSGNPEALTLGPDGNIYFSTAFGTNSDKIYKLDLTNNDAVSVFVATTAAGYTLNNPRGIAFASDGNLYVADRNAAIGGNAAMDAIRRFDGTTGAFLSNLATPDNPQGLSFDAANNRLLTSVFGNSDIFQYALDGTNSRIYDQSAGITFLDVEAIDGNVYFTNFNAGTVNVITALTTAPAVVTGLTGPGHLLVVPEPATSALLLGAIGLLGLRRRRR